MSAYEIFPSYYDQLTGDVDYPGMCKFICNVLPDPCLIADVACGTGTLAVLLAKAGYDVIGIDGSASMLSYAADKAAEAGVNLLLLQQEMDEIDLYGTVDGFLCTLDSLNHLEDLSQVKRALERVSLFLNPGGFFIFDVNTLYKHRCVLGDNAFFTDCDDLFCAWQNSYDEKDSSVEIALDFFKREGELYRRESENFKEIYLSPDFIKNTLSQCGMTLVDVYDDYGENAPGELTQRITYVARKK